MSEVLNQLLDAALFQGGYNTRVVILGTTLLGIASGVVGCFALLHKKTLSGDAAAHAALPGLAMAFIFTVYFGGESRASLPLLIGAGVTSTLALLGVEWLLSSRRLDSDTASAAVLSVFFGSGILLLSIIQNLQTGRAGGLQHFIFGQTASLSALDAVLAGIGAVFSAALCYVAFKEFRIIGFDRDYAITQGYSARWIDLLLITLIVFVTLIGLHAVGILLIVSALIIPAASARFWTESLGPMTVISGILGGLSGYGGSVVSAAVTNAPTGAVIVIVSGFFFLVSFLFAPKRGVIAAFLRRMVQIVVVAAEHLLRESYERLEELSPQERLRVTLDLRNLHTFRYSSRFVRWPAVILLWWQGMLALRPGKKVQVTEVGGARALQLIRRNRLWGEYLLRFGAHPYTHLDISADLAEHVISEKLLQELEQSLHG